MKLTARGVSDAWLEKQKRHSETLRGRKRPEQASVILALHAAGRLKKSESQKAEISVRVRNWIEKNGHPRGALGMKHNKESKLLMSQKSIEAAKKRTDDEWLARSIKAAKTRERNGTPLPKREKATWKAGWREIGGKNKFYRSRWEANYARYLEWMKSNGNISDWAHEPKTFWFDGIKRGSVSYLPDFHVIENSGDEAYHEVKGWMDDRSKTKIKRMAKYHPTVELIVIATKQYNELS